MKKKICHRRTQSSNQMQLYGLKNADQNKGNHSFVCNQPEDPFLNKYSDNKGFHKKKKSKEQDDTDYFAKNLDLIEKNRSKINSETNHYKQEKKKQIKKDQNKDNKKKNTKLEKDQIKRKLLKKKQKQCLTKISSQNQIHHKKSTSTFTSAQQAQQKLFRLQSQLNNTIKNNLKLQKQKSQLQNKIQSLTSMNQQAYKTIKLCNKRCKDFQQKQLQMINIIESLQRNNITEHSLY